ncbi:MAG: ribonuclease III [Clostridiales bacterium]|nr:ribonuclease III [Clostridiales bacterium]
MIFDLSGCEEKIGYTFTDKMLLRNCFTHASYAYEHGEKDNELLEFFGDSIIEFVVTEYLYKNAAGDEGKLTKKRAEIVSKDPLLRAVKKLGLEDFVLLGRGQEKSSKQDEKLFSSIYEAIVAGIYLDGGLTEAKNFIRRTIIADYEQKESVANKVKPTNDSKNKFQEYVQKYKLGSISYQTLGRIGPDHSPEFRVAVLLNGIRVAEGKGGSKKAAEAVAAELALIKISKKAQAKPKNITIKRQGGKK